MWLKLINLGEDPVNVVLKHRDPHQSYWCCSFKGWGYWQSMISQQPKVEAPPLQEWFALTAFISLATKLLREADVYQEAKAEQCLGCLLRLSSTLQSGTTTADTCKIMIKVRFIKDHESDSSLCSFESSPLRPSHLAHCNVSVCGLRRRSSGLWGERVTGRWARCWVLVWPETGCCWRLTHWAPAGEQRDTLSNRRETVYYCCSFMHVGWVKVCQRRTSHLSLFKNYYLIWIQSCGEGVTAGNLICCRIIRIYYLLVPQWDHFTTAENSWNLQANEAKEQ